MYGPLHSSLRSPSEAEHAEKVEEGFMGMELFEKSLKSAIADDNLVDDVYVDRHFELFLKAGNRRAFSAKNAFPTTSESEKIKDLQQPALIMWGEEDTFVPVENAYKFEKDLVNDTLIIYSNIGHIPMEEIPQRSFKDFFSFVIR